MAEIIFKEVCILKKFANAAVSECLPTHGVIGIFRGCISYTLGVENRAEENAMTRYNNSRKVSVFLDSEERGETGGR